MRDDQYAKLQKLQEKLTDVVLVEADPASWSGDGKTLADLSRDERGDRYWSKKNAAATLTVLMKVVSLTGHIERNMAGAPLVNPPEGEDELDREVRNAEKQAQALLAKLERRTAKRGRAN